MSVLSVKSYLSATVNKSSQIQIPYRAEPLSDDSVRMKWLNKEYVVQNLYLLISLKIT